MGAVSKYVRIEAPAEAVYGLWRDPSQFPEFMPDVRSVEARGDRWRPRGDRAEVDPDEARPPADPTRLHRRADG